MRSTRFIPLFAALATLSVAATAGATPEPLQSAQPSVVVETAARWHGWAGPDAGKATVAPKPIPLIVTAVAGAVGVMTGVALLEGQTPGPFGIVPGVPATVPAADVPGLAQPRPTPFDARGASIRIVF